MRFLELFFRKRKPLSYKAAINKKITSDGTGIGLYTAKKICDIHNGTISVREVYDPQKKVNNFVIDIGLMKTYNI